MRVLILSKEAWRDEQNGGNVLSNIFSNIDAEFAQIYCTDVEPNNHICKRYYQMTDKMMVRNILKKEKVGLIRDYVSYPTQTAIGNEAYSGLKIFNAEAIRVAREIIWKIADKNTNELYRFIEEFEPDVFFAPCYGSHYMIYFTCIIAKRFPTLPIISYISDDFYTNKQFKFSPFYWVNHFLLRKNVRKVFGLYRLVYTMTDEQKKQCENDFHANMKILRKTGEFEDDRIKQLVNNPIKMVYAGGIYINRWKTLLHLKHAIEEINKDDVKIVLDIYTGTKLRKSIYEKLSDNRSSFLHDVVSMEELRKIYAQSDIALHVEGFDLKSRYQVRMSFSTKIVDCLDSGCAPMAICDSYQAGFAYLKRNDAAICIDSLRNLKSEIERIVNNPECIISIQNKAFELGRKNHLAKTSHDMILQDFNKYGDK